MLCALLFINNRHCLEHELHHQHCSCSVNLHPRLLHQLHQESGQGGQAGGLCRQHTARQRHEQGAGIWLSGL